MDDFNEYNFLCHYGILGMKWGVRRYQNYDGTYTRQGLERYKSSQAAYDAADERYKSLKKSKADRADIKAAKRDRKQAKHDVKSTYKRLKYDKLADEGREYYSETKRINEHTETRRKLGIALYMGTAIATVASHEFLKGKNISTKYGDVPLNKAVAAGVAVAGLGVATAVSAKHKHEDKRLRAFYSHKSYNPRKKVEEKNKDDKRSSYAAEKEKNSAFYSKTEQKQIKKEHKENVHIEEKRLSAKYEAREKEIREEIDRLAKKYDFDLDDGGGGKTKEDEKAGARYMLLWEEIDDLDRQRRNEAIDVSLKKIEDKYGKSGTVYAKKARV